MVGGHSGSIISRSPSSARAEGWPRKAYMRSLGSLHESSEAWSSKSKNNCFVRRIWAYEISLFVPRPRDIAHSDSGSAQDWLRIFLGLLNPRCQRARTLGCKCVIVLLVLAFWLRQGANSYSCVLCSAEVAVPDQLYSAPSSRAILGVLASGQNPLLSDSLDTSGSRKIPAKRAAKLPRNSVAIGNSRGLE